MSVKPLTIIQLNTGKQREVYWSLFNAQDTTTADFLCITEPYIFKNPIDQTPAISGHPSWNMVMPTAINQSSRINHSFRSFIAVNKRITQYSQVPVASPDIAAITINTPIGVILLVSSYVPKHHYKPTSEALLSEHLSHLRQCIHHTAQLHQGQSVHLMLNGDYNRHDPLWGGPSTRLYHGTSGDQIITFMQEQSIQNIVPQGTITYEHRAGTGDSTIDLFLCSDVLVHRLSKCGIFTIDHGTDHKPIFTEFDVQMSILPSLPLRPNFAKADWDRVRSEARRVLPVFPTCETPDSIDSAVLAFHDIIKGVVAATVPVARPFPNAKRWWTSELTTLRNNHSFWRNKWTTEKRRGIWREELQLEVRNAKRQYFNEMRKQKKLHWQDFLSNPMNIWKAHASTKLSSGFGAIAPLQGDQLEDTNEGKAALLLESFFPS